MQRLTGTDFPFQTSNAALALSLYGAGVPFHDKDAPLTNTYTAETLRSMGYGGSIEAAMLEAFASGKKGHVEYGFKQTLNQPDAVTAFNGVRKRVEAGDETMKVFADLQHGLVAGTMSRAECLAAATHLVILRWRGELGLWAQMPGFGIQKRKQEAKDYDGEKLIEQTFILNGFPEFSAAVLGVRIAFLALWKQVKPLVSLHRAGKPYGKPDEEGVRMPGFLYHCADTSNDARRDLGIATK